MALVLKSIYTGYKEYFIDCQNEQNEGNYLVQSPVPILTIVVSYLYFVKHFGPKFMEDRKPYQLKGIMALYNVAQVLINLYIAVAGFYFSYWQPDYDYSCREQMRDSSKRQQLKFVLKMFMWSRIFDLLDTIFSILRRRDYQVTFLHVYHHCAVAFGEYLHNRFFAGSHYMLLVLINCVVHMVMYAYYTLAIYNPGLKLSLWKRRITELQMVQFTILILHFTWPLLCSTSCSLPKIFCFTAATQNLFMLVLFSDFYVRSYMKKDGDERKVK